MNDSIRHLYKLAGHSTKKIIGLMSGTSLDGLDIALCGITGAGRSTEVKLLEFDTVAYPKKIKRRLQDITSVDMVSLEEVCILHTWLGDYHASLINECLEKWGYEPDEIDCVASHGQTIYHAPFSKHRQENMPNATLQIADADHIARQTGILTVSDFRQKHTAAGGEGAPMAALVDELLFRDSNNSRILLNIGGIANFTYLPALLDPETVVTTDTGPGNTIIDAAVQKFYKESYDENGRIAAGGEVNKKLLRRLKEHPFFEESPPKTTGPEQFNLQWVEKVLSKLNVRGIGNKNLIATLTRLSAETISEAILHIAGKNIPDVYISGGGMHNKQLIEWIEELLDVKVQSFEEIGFNPDAKEAVIFAVLANELLTGEGFYLQPDMQEQIHFGKISFPK